MPKRPTLLAIGEQEPPSIESDREWLQRKYRESGFVVFACNYPKDIGEVLNPEDDFDNELCRWRVTGLSSASELLGQLRDIDSAFLKRPFFYRAEAMD